MNDIYYDLGFIILFLYSNPKFSFYSTYDFLLSMKCKVLKIKHIWKYKMVMNRIISMSKCRKNGIRGYQVHKNINSYHKESGYPEISKHWLCYMFWPWILWR